MINLRKVPIWLWVTLTLILLLIGLTVANAYVRLGKSNMVFDFVSVFDVSSQSEESIELDYQEGMTLAVNSEGGDITVIGSDRKDIQVDMVKTGWGDNTSSAKQVAENLEVTVEESGNTVTLTFKMPPVVSAFSNSQGNNTVDFTIYVPSNIDLDLETNFGDFSSENTSGSLTVDDDFGDVTVIDHTGELTLSGRNGANHIENVDAGSGEISISNDFGNFNLSNLSAEVISVFSRNGKIDAYNIDANTELKIETDFGELNLDQFSGTGLIIDSRNGKIELINGQLTELLDLTSDFGDITLENVSTPETTLNTKNGDTELSSAKGTLTIHSDFGSVTINNGDNVTLDVEMKNGKLEFSGSLDGDNPQSISNQFGDIFITLPEDSAFDLDVETKFGSIHSEFPITITGEIDPLKWNAKLNGGGENFKIVTDNGDIKLIILE